MKAITLTQPYAALIALGEKRVETRGWSTPYRGPLAIHAGRYNPKSAEYQAAFDEPISDILASHGITNPQTDLIFSAVVCVVDLVACVRMSDLIVGRSDWLNERYEYQGERISKQEIELGYWRPERYAWVLRNPQLLRAPLVTRGYQGLWDVDERQVAPWLSASVA